MDTTLGITTRRECGMLVISAVASVSNAGRVGVLPGSVIMAVAGRDVAHRFPGLRCAPDLTGPSP